MGEIKKEKTWAIYTDSLILLLAIAKQAIHLSGVTTRLPLTDYYLTIGRARNSEWPWE